MKRKFIQILSLISVCLLLTVAGFSQNDSRTVSSAAGDLYVISAKAGGINLIEGNVSVKRKDAGTNLLIKGDNLKVGEKVITEKSSKAEILLNPGSFARLGEKTEFEFVDTSLDDLKLHLTRGFAVFEVYATDDFRITLTSPNSRFYLVKSGIYRLDILPNGSSRLQVWKGQAQVGDVASTKVKSSREVIVSGSNVAVQKFDRDDKDNFDQWSKDRAKQLANANARLQRNTLKDSLINSFGNNRWSGFNTFGLWTYDASFGGYCFLPFGYGWSSPYGYGFNRNFFSSRPSYNFYSRVYQGTVVNSGNRTNRETTNPGTNRGGNRTQPEMPGTDPGRTAPERIASPRRVDPSPSTAPRSTPIRRSGRIKSPIIDN